jgi:hypothetical protein
MNKPAWMIVLVLIGVLAWLWLAPPPLAPLEDPWGTLAEEADRSAMLADKLEASKRFRAFLEQTEQAMIDEGLPLRNAAELLLHYCASHYDDFIQITNVGAYGERTPREDETQLERMALLLVRRTRLEVHVYRSRFGYSPELLQRLEREWRELQRAVRCASEPSPPRSN